MQTVEQTLQIQINKQIHILSYKQQLENIC